MNNAHQWIDAIIDSLFKAENRRIDRTITELTRRNNSLKKITAPGFIHMGRKHIPNELAYQYAANRMANVHLPLLHFELIAEVSKLQVDLDQLQNDETAIRQILWKLLRDRNTYQEIRDALPDCISNTIQSLAGIERMIPDPRHYLEHDQRALRMYNRILPKIEMYSVAGMLY